MGTHDINFSERFEFTGKAKIYSIIGIVIGVLAVAYGFLAGDEIMHERTFANLLLMAYYFACVCMAATFFLAIQYVAQAGWSTAILRVPQAMAKTLPIAAVILLVIISLGLATHGLYHHWHADGITDPSSPNFDAVIAGKSGYLNVPFFMSREVILLGIYSLFSWLLAKYSYNEDLAGGLAYYNKSFKVSVIFLVVYGFTSPVFSFDTIMSLEAHWFSTMFGWYNFAAMWVSSLSVIAVVVILLRRAGYMPWVNNSHLHNLGQFIFGFSIFWTYTWFAQFLLTYYANIPEESIYFFKRFEYYEFWFYMNLILNFLTPVLLLMDRDNKRSDLKLLTVAILVLIGHWVDYYQMIMPGAVKDGYNGLGIVEIGTAIGFVGIFAFTVLTNISKKPLIAKNHPLLQESLHHQL